MNFINSQLELITSITLSPQVLICHTLYLEYFLDASLPLLSGWQASEFYCWCAVGGPLELGFT